MLEDFGNMIAINGQKIPAKNIQVHDGSGYFVHEDGTDAWYGVCFEVMFEQGHLWVIRQCAGEMAHDKRIMVEVFHDYANTDSVIEPDLVIPCSHWDDFLEMYNAKDEYWGAVTLPFWVLSFFYI